jgi:hypothetical protein
MSQDTVSWKFTRSRSVVWFPVARGKAREKSNIVFSAPAAITAWHEIFLATEILLSAFQTLW